MSGSWGFWKPWSRGTQLSVFVASLTNVNSERVLWYQSIWVCTLTESMLHGLYWGRRKQTLKYNNGKETKTAAILSKKILWREVMFTRHVRGIFVANEPARVSKLLPVYDACPVCVDGHEISIFRCVVWMEIICECCWNPPLDWDIFY